MSFNIPGEVNPFEAPQAGIGDQIPYLDFADDDAELIRRQHLSHEANVRSVGVLYYLGACFLAFITFGVMLVVTGVMPMPPNQQQGVDPAMQKLFMGFGAVFYLLISLLFGAMGYGLTHIQVWARWTVLAFTAIELVIVLAVSVGLILLSPVAGILVLVFGGGILGFIFYLLVSSKAGVVFSGEYKEVIRKTPHIKHKINILVKILLIIVVAFLMLAFVSGFISGLRN